MPLYRVQKMRVRQVGAILTSKGFKLGAGGGGEPEVATEGGSLFEGPRFDATRTANQRSHAPN